VSIIFTGKYHDLPKVGQKLSHIQIGTQSRRWCIILI